MRVVKNRTRLLNAVICFISVISVCVIVNAQPKPTPTPKKDTTQLIAELSSKDAKVREEAAKSLGDMKATEARDPLVAALKDKVSDVRASAAKALGQLKDAAAVGPLMPLLREDDYFVREEATEALAAIGKPAIAPLITALADRSENVRDGAIDALAKLGDTALEELLAAMKSPSPIVRRGAADALSDNGDEKKAAAFAAALKAKDLAVIAGAYDYFDDESDSAAPESLLIAALNAYGTQSMAEHFMESDSRKIKAAAKAWAARHGCRNVAYLTTSGMRNGIDCTPRRKR